MSNEIRRTLRNGAAAVGLLVVALLTPWDCKEQCKACVCRFDAGAWTCECIAPREGQGA